MNTSKILEIGMTLLRQMIFKHILFCVLICSFMPLEAHSRSESYSKFNFLSENNKISVQVSASIKQDIFNGLNPTSRFDSYEGLADYLNHSIDLGASCNLSGPAEINENIALGMLKFYWSFECSQMPVRIMVFMFQDFGITHTHIARGAINGETIPEFMFASDQDVWLIGTKAEGNNNQSSYWGYLESGVKHILSGWDHLTFLLGLLLLFHGRLLMVAITGFTLGHSLTLGLGAMNILRVHSEMVEILIGFSILLLAIEKLFKHEFEFNQFVRNLSIAMLTLVPLVIFGNIQPVLLLGLSLFLTIYLSLVNHYSTKWLPLLITVFFGLVHGLGFASSIAESGLPQDKLWQIILSFNLGVEIGQLAVALGVLALLSIAKKNLAHHNFQNIHNMMGAIVFSLGTFWFVSRAVGI